MLEMQALFEDLPNDRCSVTVTYRIDTHPIFKIFEPFLGAIQAFVLGHLVGRCGCGARRFTSSGFKEFSGIEYINKTLPKPDDLEPGKYESNHPSESLPRSQRRKALSDLRSQHRARICR
jgi:hypothetical protein